MCQKCEGAGVIYDDVEKISTIQTDFPKGKGCKTCSGSGINIKMHNVDFYKGELIYCSKGTTRIGMFIREVNRHESLVALGSNFYTVKNDFITFINLTPANPKNMYKFDDPDHRM